MQLKLLDWYKYLPNNFTLRRAKKTKKKLTGYDMYTKQDII